MKKTLKVLAIVFALLIGTLIITPFFFKDKIAKIAKEEINKNVNAVINFEEVSLGLFTNFPDFTFSISKLSVIGISDFKDNTLFNSDKISLTIDLASVFSGNYKVKEIYIGKSELNLLALKNGKANWNIAIEESDNTKLEEGEEALSATETSEENGSFNFAIDKFTLKDIDITYTDIKEEMESVIENLNLELNGDFSASTANINLNSSIDEFSVKMGSISYLTKSNIRFNAEILSDLDSSKYTFKENSMSINDVAMNFDGFVSMPGDDIYTDIKFNTPNTNFKSLLSLIPAFYAKDFAGISAEGDFNISGWAKGIYNEQLMPSFNLDLAVNDGNFQYPDLPKSVKDININTNIYSPSSDINDMKIDVSKFHFSIANNPMDISLKLTNPIEDPNIDATFKGKMDLASLEQVYPMESDMKLSGIFRTNIALKGKQSDLDKGRYNKFKASGAMNLIKVNYSDKDLAEGVMIHKASLDFSPRFINISEFKTTYNKNTINFSGKVSNYMSYALSDGILKGDFKMVADYINFDDLISSEEVIEENAKTAEESTTETISEEVAQAVEIPANIDMNLQCIIGRIKYDKMQIKAIYGNMVIKDKIAEIDNLKMELLDGKMEMNGYYSTVNIDTPRVNLVLGMHNFNIKKTYKAMDMVQKLAPIMDKTSGHFSTIFSYTSTLDNKMEPVLNTVNANGLLSTSKLTIKGAESIEKLADQLKVKELKVLKTTPMAIPFKIVNGDLIVSEFKTTINDMPLTAKGTTKLSQEIDYKLRMEVPRENLGSDANKTISQIEEQAKAFGIDVSVSKTIIVKAKITGTAMKPEVGLDFDKAKEEIKETATEKAKEVAKDESKKEANKQVDNASKEADKAIENSDLSDEEKEKAKELKKKLEKEAKKLLDLW